MKFSKKNLVAGSVLLGAMAAFAADPKVGATVTFLRGANTESYLSNKFFKDRPVAAEMIKRDITSNVRNLVSGETFAVTVPKGGRVVQSLLKEKQLK